MLCQICVSQRAGVMGKGLALAFKKQFPENFDAYREACGNGSCAVGKVFTFDRGEEYTPRFIVNFPTKNDWRPPSKIEFIASGLASLVTEIENLEISSIALPALGCGLGGLEWHEVLAQVKLVFEQRTEVNVALFEPG